MSDFARDPAWLQRRYDECLRDIELIAAPPTASPGQIGGAVDAHSNAADEDARFGGYPAKKRRASSENQAL
jgi:hypothetical protein